MKKKILIIAVLLIGLFCTAYFWNKYSYADQEKYFTSDTKPENGLQIGIIGDSWVVRQNLDSLLEAKLMEQGIHAEVYASGNPGAKTKRIYENLFKNRKEEFSSKEVIEKKPDYCIIIAGVNDAATHVGPDFYTHHMVMMISTLLHYGIKPVVIPLPEFGLKEDSERKNILSSLSNKGAELVLNNGKEFEIKDYRNALLKALKQNGLENRIVLLNFDEVSSDFNKDRGLYADPLHLNEQGYQKFSDFLAESIVNLQNNR